MLANRIWLHHFGRGIVDTPGDFGVLGQRPTHPELLDWLAAELVRQGWSLKRMHKLIMTSTAYRQSSRRRSAEDAVDSGNALYGRYPVRRLEAEALRDRMLATSAAGSIAALFGPPVPVVEDAVGQVIVPDDKPRRSVYLQVRRSKPVAFLTRVRRAGRRTELRPAHLQHGRPAGPDADEQRFRPPAGQATSPGGCCTRPRPAATGRPCTSA